ncbi:MAG: hypothetical protein E5Y73_22070 [Mesorhizobium sp.]|nr:MAG: hypothetical protein E5Y73_22070 [Mesorhizobium sp.]
MRWALYCAPLWPAGHLPHKGRDWLSCLLPLITNVAGLAARAKLPISPLVGEMSGRTEGGASRRRIKSHRRAPPR